MSQNKIKNDVRQFYDQVGWRAVSEGVYQNAQYEDLRPVSREYIHRCHMRINRHIKKEGRFFLDAGSGPIQYPEYLTYSEGYQYRVCLDISIVALMDARNRIGAHGLLVVGDIAHLPFKEDSFEGIVSLHTIHHLPPQDYLSAFLEINRVLADDAAAVVVNGWDESALMRYFNPPIVLMEKLTNRGIHREAEENNAKPKAEKPQRTHVYKLTAEKLRLLMDGVIPVNIYVWRSASVRFLRALIHPWLFGRILLKILFFLEETYPRYFGEKGQYPLITMAKTRRL